MPREGHDTYNPIENYDRKISIHVPREGHDSGLVSIYNKNIYISIHVPREGHDLQKQRKR